jgi:hypothetical protein
MIIIIYLKVECASKNVRPWQVFFSIGLKVVVGKRGYKINNRTIKGALQWVASLITSSIDSSPCIPSNLFLVLYAFYPCEILQLVVIFNIRSSSSKADFEFKNLLIFWMLEVLLVPYLEFILLCCYLVRLKSQIVFLSFQWAWDFQSWCLDTWYGILFFLYRWPWKFRSNLSNSPRSWNSGTRVCPRSFKPIWMFRTSQKN